MPYHFLAEQMSNCLEEEQSQNFQVLYPRLSATIVKYILLFKMLFHKHDTK